jgi:hypothetical protein
VLIGRHSNHLVCGLGRGVVSCRVDVEGVKKRLSMRNRSLVTDKVGNIEIAFVDYSSSKKVHLAPDIVEYKPGIDTPMYDLIIGKNTMHDLGVVLDFNQSTIQIDKILLPMRDIANLQLK